jgi:alpha-galactosidase
VTVTAGASGGSGEYPDNVYLTVSTDGQAVTNVSPSVSPSRDTEDSAAKRTKIVIWVCDPTAQGQGWTYRGDKWTYRGDKLRIHGDMCVNAKGRGTSGSPVILWPCDGSPNEIWIRRSNGEYVLKANGYKLCLTAPAYSTGDGTQAAVGVCSDARDQRWSLP